LNLKQLEEIKKRIDEIKALLKQDPIGSIRIKEDVDALELDVLNHMQEELWSLYEQGRIKVEE